MKRYLPLLLIVFVIFLFTSHVLAANIGDFYYIDKSNEKIQGSIDGEVLTFEKVTPLFGPTPTNTDYIEYMANSKNFVPGPPTTGNTYYLRALKSDSSSATIKKELWKNNNIYVEWDNQPVTVKASFSSLFPGLTCSGTNTLQCWINTVFNWSLGIVGSIAVVVIAAGGVIYMTSGGNPDRVGQAKKLIGNALAGAGILLLARFFLTKILGVPF